MNLKLIFGFPVNERFVYSQQLYYSIKKFCHDPLVLFASDKNNIGYSHDKLRKVTSKRKSRLYNLNPFLFDIIEEIKDLEFDYFVKLDSDCLFANFGFEELLAEKFDFLVSVDENENKCEWSNAELLHMNIKSYERLITDLGLIRRDQRIVGCFGALQVYSKKAVGFIADRIRMIEASTGYAELQEAGMCLEEVLFPNLLKDAGFKQHMLYMEGEQKCPLLCVRFKPYISRKEVKLPENRDLAILYHPLIRSFFNGARRILLKRIGY